MPNTSVGGLGTLDDRLAERVARPDYRAWRARVEATGGCLQPIHLSGEYRIEDAWSGADLLRRTGTVFVPCGNRRASVCPSCADRYAADAFHLVRAGLCGGKNVPEAVASAVRLFVTLTAPSFGPVHTRRVRDSGETVRCRCGIRHHGDDPRVGTALDPDTYDYAGAVLWNVHASTLWHRFTIRLRRKLAQAVGITVRDFRQHARISYTKVAEYQRRGLVHFHAVIRLDGPDGPTDPIPAWADDDLLASLVPVAAAATEITDTHTTPDGRAETRTYRWGEQVDVRTVAPADTASLKDQDGAITDRALAGYIAKYATKGTTATETADRPIRSEYDIAAIHTTPHHRTMIRTAWDYGAVEGQGHLRAWAHMLGFRGHFLTKSRHYSVQFGTLRDARTAHNHAATLDELGVTDDDITVINHWNHVGNGYTTDAEYELASAIYERHRQHRKEKYRKENETWNR